MLLVDDLLMSPVSGVLWIFKKIHEAALEAQAGEADQLMAQLTDLHRELEAGRLTEAEFDEREGPLLDRLDEIRERDAGGESSADGDAEGEDDAQTEDGAEEADDGDDADDEDEDDEDADDGARALGEDDADDEDGAEDDAPDEPDGVAGEERGGEG